MYDLVIIGAGIGGYTAALKASKEGLKTAIIEKREIGGTCLNRGCIPTKYLVAKAHDISGVEKMIAQGLAVGSISTNYSAVSEQLHDKLSRLSKGVEWLLQNEGVDIFSGKASFVDKNHISIDGKEVIETDKIIIATGSCPRELNNIEKSGKVNRIFNSDNIFSELKDIPKSITIIGGGIIGLEFAFIYSAFGSHVTILESRDTLLENIDRDLNTEVMRMLHDSSIELILDCSIADIVSDDICVTVYDDEEEVISKSEILLVAIGRSGNIAGLNLENVGIDNKNGFISTDDHFLANGDNIFAIGDVTGKESLAYVAAAQGENVVSHILGKTLSKDLSVYPKCIFLNLDVAYVGLTSSKASEMGAEVIESKFMMSANGRSFVEGNNGFIKLFADKKDKTIVGGVCVCKSASEIINIISQAIQNKMTVSDFSHIVLPHPTYCEALQDANSILYDLR